MRVLFVLALAAAAVSVSSSAEARYEGPWCSVESIGSGAVYEDCSLRSLEQCRRLVIAGNRGFCVQNPRWPGYYQTFYDEPPRYRRHKRRN